MRKIAKDQKWPFLKFCRKFETSIFYPILTVLDSSPSEAGHDTASARLSAAARSPRSLRQHEGPQGTREKNRLSDTRPNYFLPFSFSFATAKNKNEQEPLDVQAEYQFVMGYYCRAEKDSKTFRGQYCCFEIYRLLDTCIWSYLGKVILPLVLLSFFC